MILLDVLDRLPFAFGSVLAAVLGAIFGSFIAALALRWPRGEGLGGRSHCDSCGRVLGPLELVPLLSHLWLRGRCRGCGAAIHHFHARVEAAGALIGCAALLIMPGVAGWAWAVMGWMILPLLLLDARHYWLPDRLTIPMAVVGLLIGGPLTGADLDQRLIGALAAGLSLLLLRWAYRAVRGRDGMGGGDPKLFAAIGAWLGWQALPLVLVLASFSGIAWAILGHEKRNQPAMQRRVPFGVFLGVGGWIAAALFPHILAR